MYFFSGVSYSARSFLALLFHAAGFPYSLSNPQLSSHIYEWRVYWLTSTASSQGCSDVLQACHWWLALLEGLSECPQRSPHPDTAGPLGQRSASGSKMLRCIFSWWSFQSCLLPISVCCGGPQTYLESIFRFSLQPALSDGHQWQPKLTKMSKLSLLGEYWSLVACGPILLFVRIDLTWTATRLPQPLPLHTLVYPGFFFHRFPSPTCFLAPRKSSNFLFFNNTAVIFQSFYFVFLFKSIILSEVSLLEFLKTRPWAPLLPIHS